MKKVTIYMRPGCHLCEEAEAIVRPLAETAGRDVELINIELDDELHKRFLVLIPVIELDGVELARLDEFRNGSLQKAIARD